jgi:predicted metal-dependent phosphoesterase TrpH
MKCDFHLHSTFSDGQLTPEQLMEWAKERKLDAVSLTDHDTIEGVERAIKKGEELGLKVLSGIEMSCFDKTEVHMLIYNMDYKNPDFQNSLNYVNELRLSRNHLIIEKLSSLGINIDIDKIYSRSEGKTVGRPDIADEMVRLGFAESRSDAFDKYLGIDRCAYVPAHRISPKAAIELAHRFNGLAVLAHPKNLRLPQHAMIDFVEELVSCGLNGIEADYFSHNTLERKFYKSLADKYKLIVTGGSDFHDIAHGGKEVFYPNKRTRKALDLGE